MVFLRNTRFYGWRRSPLAFIVASTFGNAMAKTKVDNVIEDLKQVIKDADELLRPAPRFYLVSSSGTVSSGW
jgi:hypothetical protein